MSTSAEDGGAVPEELDREECLRLIAPGGVGRVAFDDGEGPTVLPVNYILDGDTVVFRTTLGGRINTGVTTVLRGAEVRVAFEVDRFDERLEEGWSVLLRGPAHHLSEDEIERAPKVRPWPRGPRESFISLTPVEISGRRLRRG
ncbi:pyridoxamine 5'-phosphate oxidase family protein [Actinomadura atramentaria]|uniref:pyridoxamine 5'-phosphate oxidase family protein n=1 Tax=Actinomadura atramentaria TaxID=1990 RepID=UPI00037FED15|nr:pyridoxamine 5'-phosphate oxidase family protein [Actinomadura atramentaria]